MSSTAEAPWWQSGVVYQIYPRSWADGNGDGIGDFRGMTARLDYLVDTLGVEAVWVSPFYPSPQADFGYDVSDYCAVDPVYGTLGDFDRFLEVAHQKGLRVIIDWVPNHTSDQHPWFVASRSSRDHPQREWYVWRDPRPDGGPPNNWISLFGGPAWTFDPATGQYYLHSFLSEQPDLNWRHPDAEEAMLNTLRFWLDRGVDGFRIDVAQRCLKDPHLRDNPPAVHPPEAAYKLNPEYAAFDHIYDTAHPDIHLLFRRIRALVDSYGATAPRVTIGEIHEYNWRIWSSYYGWALDELHMPFNFSLLPSGLHADAIRRAVEGIEASLPTGAWPNWVVGNHDEPRCTQRLGWEASKAAAVLLLTLRGTPTIYYGDELGMLQVEIPPERQQDPWGRRMPGFGRDGNRTPMQWTPADHAGFSVDSTAVPWLPVHQHGRINVETELEDPGSHLTLYRKLLALRRSRASLRLGDIAFWGVWEEPNPLMYSRTLEAERTWVALNLSDRERVVAFPDSVTVLAGTHPDREGEALVGSVHLQPWESLVAG